jgi:hypothetical protein
VVLVGVGVYLLRKWRTADPLTTSQPESLRPRAPATG